MTDSVVIIECPRDAFQGLPEIIPTSLKIQYLLALIDAGFPRIDFGSFVSPRAVPQMQDTLEVFREIRPRLGSTELLAIIPNQRGLARLVEAGGIHWAGYPLSLSETFQRRNLKQGFREAWGLVGELIRDTQAAGVGFVTYLSMAFGNPYGDPWSPELVLQFVERLLDQGAGQISLADTVGMARAHQIREVVQSCRLRFPSLSFGLHLHTRSDDWEEPLQAAYDAGCRRFDGNLQGIGGCPFAEDELVGNLPTEQVVRKFGELGIETGLELAALDRPLRLAREIQAKYGTRGAAAES